MPAWETPTTDSHTNHDSDRHTYSGVPNANTNTVRLVHANTNRHPNAVRLVTNTNGHPNTRRSYACSKPLNPFAS